MRIRIRDLLDPGSGIRDGKILIRNKHPGFATLKKPVFHVQQSRSLSHLSSLFPQGFDRSGKKSVHPLHIVPAAKSINQPHVSSNWVVFHSVNKMTSNCRRNNKSNSKYFFPIIKKETKLIYNLIKLIN
jgi:hypothetical protein